MTRIYLLLAGALCCLLSCSQPATPPNEPQAADAEFTICVVHYPLKYVAERIAGEGVQVLLPVPPGVDPAMWSPDDALVAKVQDADLILLNGAGYASWINRVSLPDSKLVDTSRGFSDHFLPLDDTLLHRHGPSGRPEKGPVATITWLDPRLLLKQAAAVKTALTAALPSRKQLFDENFLRLEVDLQELDDRLQAVSNVEAARLILATEPVYQYLAKRCSWDLHIWPGASGELPNAPAWQEFDQLMNGHSAGLLLGTQVPDAAIVDKLKERGISCVVFDPCAQQPEVGDYLQVMRENIDRLESTLRSIDSRPAQ